MLDVAYEAVEDLPPGRLAQIDEGKGLIRVRLDKNEALARVVAQLNLEIDQLMSSSHWFQLWKNEIVSRATPGCPLRIRYVFRDWAPNEPAVAEDRGVITVYINPSLTTEQFAAAMNPATEKQLAAGHWFQLHDGEIIDNAPEPMSQV
ncbi:hypothetical protein AB0K53_01300 [Streptomyces tuirus]|uniref:hypothetical protein n=1 Tax=Streptomyces tuirus TaxID=68278 RepID=UPI0034207B3B